MKWHDYPKERRSRDPVKGSTGLIMYAESNAKRNIKRELHSRAIF